MAEYVKRKLAPLSATRINGSELRGVITTLDIALLDKNGIVTVNKPREAPLEITWKKLNKLL